MIGLSIDLEQEVEMTCAGGNKQYWINKGYNPPKAFHKFIVKAKDLPPASNVKVEVVCDVCSESLYRSFNNYNKMCQDGHGFDVCSKCRGRKSGISRRNAKEDIVEFLSNYNCVLVSDYLSVNSPIEVIASCGHSYKTNITTLRAKAKNKGEIICTPCAKIKYNGLRNDDFSEEIKLLNDNGCEFVDFQRSNGRVYIEFIGQCGHHEKVNIVTIHSDNFSFLCKMCSYRKIREDTTHTLQEAQKIFTEHGFILLEKEYFNCKTNMLCKCSCGNVYRTSLTRVINGDKCGCQRLRGEENNKFNPALTQEDRENRRIINGYHFWRTSVYERDNFTCCCCGQVGGNLNAHHILNYADNRKLRMSVKNGITLCKLCHTAFHKIYGKRNNTKEQLDEFIQINQKQTKDAV